MDPSKRIVIKLPLAELWDERSTVEAARIGWLGYEQVRQVVQSGRGQFVVADLGCPLQWVPHQDRYVFWKEEIKPHIVKEPDGRFSLDDYPYGYAYLASEWQPADPLMEAIVLLEKHH